MKSYVKETSNKIKDFMDTINDAYIHFEIEYEDYNRDPYPFYMWLEDIRMELANFDNVFWKYFYGENKNG